MPKRRIVDSDEEEEQVDFGAPAGDEDDDDGVEDIHLSKKQKKDESDAGIIERIVLENFMCHKHLDVAFGNNINFIVGVNGSMILTN